MAGTPGILKVGDSFSSFAEVKEAIEQLGEKTYTTFWKRDARTIESSKVVRPVESSLIYYQVLYACNHGGKKFKSSGKQIRQSYTFKEDCPVHVRFKASSDGKALEVTSVQTEHNHVTSKAYQDIKSRKRVKSAAYRREQNNGVIKSAVDYLNLIWPSGSAWSSTEIYSDSDIVTTPTSNNIVSPPSGFMDVHAQEMDGARSRLETDSGGSSNRGAVGVSESTLARPDTPEQLQKEHLEADQRHRTELLAIEREKLAALQRTAAAAEKQADAIAKMAETFSSYLASLPR